jgi:hypothetical protein
MASDYYDYYEDDDTYDYPEDDSDDDQDDDTDDDQDEGVIFAYQEYHQTRLEPEEIVPEQPIAPTIPQNHAPDIDDNLLDNETRCIDYCIKDERCRLAMEKIFTAESLSVDSALEELVKAGQKMLNEPRRMGFMSSVTLHKELIDGKICYVMPEFTNDIESIATSCGLRLSGEAKFKMCYRADIYVLKNNSDRSYKLNTELSQFDANNDINHADRDNV